MVEKSRNQTTMILNQTIFPVLHQCFSNLTMRDLWIKRPIKSSSVLQLTYVLNFKWNLNIVFRSWKVGFFLQKNKRNQFLYSRLAYNFFVSYFAQLSWRVLLFAVIIYSLQRTSSPESAQVPLLTTLKLLRSVRYVWLLVFKTDLCMMLILGSSNFWWLQVVNDSTQHVKWIITLHSSKCLKLFPYCLSSTSLSTFIAAFTHHLYQLDTI